MRYKIKRSMIRELIPFALVSWLIVCSGSQHFRIFHSFYTNMFLLALAILYFLREKTISYTNIIRFMIVVLFVSVNTASGVHILGLPFSRNSYIIFCISCVTLLVLQSSMEKRDFKKKYIYFMTFEAIVSLVCFVLVVYFQFSDLPGYYEHIVPYRYQEGHNIVYLTPYYTMGWYALHGFFSRNAGMFWEPGAHAVYLIIAILFVFNGALDEIKPKYKIIICGILLLGALSTKSTTGYMALALSFVFLVLRGPSKWNTRKNVIIVIGIVLGIMFVAFFGGVFDKLIYQSGSFGTRMNDTVSGMAVAFENILFGKGIFVDVSDQLQKVNIIYISNGMVGLMIGIGIPMTLVYLLILHFGIKRLFQIEGIALYCVELIFLLFMCSESLCTYPIFISLLFFWKDDCKTVMSLGKIKCRIRKKCNRK